MPIKPVEGFAKGDSTSWTEMPWAIKSLIFQDPKGKISSFAAIMRLASRSSAASQVLRDLLSTWLEGTQQPPKPLPQVTVTCPLGTDPLLQVHNLKEGEKGETQDKVRCRGSKDVLLFPSEEPKRNPEQCHGSEETPCLVAQSLWTAFGLR